MRRFLMEQGTGIEPASSAWKPMYYRCTNPAYSERCYYSRLLFQMQAEFCRYSNFLSRQSAVFLFAGPVFSLFLDILCVMSFTPPFGRRKHTATLYKKGDVSYEKSKVPPSGRAGRTAGGLRLAGWGSIRPRRDPHGNFRRAGRGGTPGAAGRSQVCCADL